MLSVVKIILKYSLKFSFTNNASCSEHLIPVERYKIKLYSVNQVT